MKNKKKTKAVNRVTNENLLEKLEELKKQIEKYEKDTGLKFVPYPYPVCPAPAYPTYPYYPYRPWEPYGTISWDGNTTSAIDASTVTYTTNWDTTVLASYI